MDGAIVRAIPFVVLDTRNPSDLVHGEARPLEPSMGMHGHAFVRLRIPNGGSVDAKCEICLPLAEFNYRPLPEDQETEATLVCYSVTWEKNELPCLRPRAEARAHAVRAESQFNHPLIHSSTDCQSMQTCQARATTHLFFRVVPPRGCLQPVPIQRTRDLLLRYGAKR
jgi:hypothetical protein